MPQRGSEGRKRPGYRERRVDVRDIRQRFLVICEGAKTEPNYFNGLRSDHRLNAEVKVVGLGLSPVQLTERAIQEAIKGYDQIWCVFDRDAWPAHNF